MSTSEAGAAATVIPIDDVARHHGAAGKAPVTAAPPPAAAAVPVAAAAPAATTTAPRKIGLPFFRQADRGSRCVALIDFVLRIAAFGPTLAAAIATGTSDETLSVFTQFFQFRARFDDFPALLFFMVANAIAAGYLVLSLPFSFVIVLRPQATGLRLLLLVCDMIMVALLTAAAAAAAAIVDLAHSGNLRANWVAICMQFHGFCQRTSGAVVASFLAVLVFILLVIMAAFAIRKR
ncbi:casparian strip membrane protein 1-like [Phragmites australis]|uniref:casparian strip membrane protein 1-like n=1 Tax=Phragmites australis TaxID=29695 RepID=UPI002D78647C|nr:casparian strip membrane protein 1-like [Phragmites australis]